MTDRLCKNCFSQSLVNGTCLNCGYKSVPFKQGKSIPLTEFTVLNERYLVGRVLGVGGFGITYKALDIYTNNHVAIKEYFPADIAERRVCDQWVVPHEALDGADYGLERFEEEASILKSLINCPQIVDVYELFKSNNTAYMVMEYVAGKSLKMLTQENGGKLPYKMAYDYFIEMALALSQAHVKNVIHRDVSPENMLVKPSGEIKLIDFGAAKVNIGPSKKSSTVILKPGFAPLEQYMANGEQGPWTDVYALACTFYRIVSGVSLPDAIERQNGATVMPLHVLMPNIVPMHVSLAVEKAMQLDIALRYKDMDAFIGAITNYENKSITKNIDSSDLRIAHDRKSIIMRDDSAEEEKPLSDFVLQMRQIMSKSVLGVKNKLKWFQEPTASLVETGEMTHLSDGVVCRVGRNEDCDLVTGNDHRISRIHCLLRYNAADNSVTVECASLNGILLSSGESLRKGEQLKLYESTVLQLANTDSRIKVVIRH